MTIEQFYKLSEDELYDGLRALRIKHCLNGISNPELLALAKRIKETNFRPINLKSYLTAISDRNKANIEMEWNELMKKTKKLENIPTTKNERQIALSYIQKKIYDLEVEIKSGITNTSNCHKVELYQMYKKILEIEKKKQNR